MHWDEAGERICLGPKLVEQATEAINKIRQRKKIAQSWQKSYADKRRRRFEFEVVEKVFLKASPVRGITRFYKKGKLGPPDIGPIEILNKGGKVAYRLALQTAMTAIHDVFHMSMLRKYIADPAHILTYPKVEITKDLKHEV